VDVSVVICAYTARRLDALEAAAASALGQDPPPAEVIVVIDGGEDLVRAARERLPPARVVPNRFAPGLAGARNSGVAAARGDVVAFLDDDASAEPGWLRALAGPYADPDVLGVGGSIAPDWAAARPAWMPPEFDWVVGCSYVGQPEGVARVRNMIGANMSARRDVLLELGGFRAALGRVGAGFQGHEETDLCIRGLERWPEGRWLLNPDARVRHRVPEARGAWGYFVRRCWGEGASKAAMVGSVGARHGLATERPYVVRTLPAGVIRHAGALRRGDRAGPLRAAAIVSGLAITAGGYLAGRLRASVRRAMTPRVAGAPCVLLAIAAGAALAGRTSDEDGRTSDGDRVTGAAARAEAAGSWRRVFADDFSRGFDRRRWGRYSGQPGGDPGGWWDPSHVRVRHGVLRLETYRDRRFGGRWVSGGVSSARALKQTYGRYRVRFRMDRGRGVAAVLLLWPVRDHWPPEIDFAEDGGRTGARSSMAATLHYGAADHQVQRSIRRDFTRWHTMGVDWLPGRLRYSIDGHVWATVRHRGVPAEPMELDLQTQAGTCGDRWAPCPDASTPRRVTMEVDRVVAYALRRAGRG
jgi:beta-glucanase (GH16 family)/GT2 family glycosyltransferase